MAKKKKPATRCNCVEQVNEQLKPMNAKITQNLRMNFATREASMSSPSIVLHKIDSKLKKPLPTVLVAFCPFCGTKSPE